MDSKLLMIGDWVYEGSNHPIKVNQNYGKSIRYDEGDYSHEVEGSCLSPIPLTAEILEKNGFECRGCISYHKPNIGLIIHHWNDDLCFLNYSKKNIPPIMIPFHYVHELQHALRLCGLNGLAENFKV